MYSTSPVNTVHVLYDLVLYKMRPENRAHEAAHSRCVDYFICSREVMPVSMSGTPVRSRPAAAFGGTANRFSAQVPSSGSTGTYDTTHGTIGAAVMKKSSNKSSGGGTPFGGGASRDSVGLWGVKPPTPRGEDAQPRSDETAPIASAFALKKASKGPSAAFGGSKDRFGTSKRNATPSAEYVPAGMGAVKKSYAKSAMMSGVKDRFAPVKAAEGGDYSGALVSDFSKAATTKSFNKARAHQSAALLIAARASCLTHAFHSRCVVTAECAEGSGLRRISPASFGRRGGGGKGSQGGWG